MHLDSIVNVLHYYIVLLILLFSGLNSNKTGSFVVILDLFKTVECLGNEWRELGQDTQNKILKLCLLLIQMMRFENLQGWVGRSMLCCHFIIFKFYVRSSFLDFSFLPFIEFYKSLVSITLSPKKLYTTKAILSSYYQYKLIN